MALLILTYHSLDEQRTPVSVPPRILQTHLERLQAAAYTVLPLKEAVSRSRQVGFGGARLAALTFDDGYRNIVDHAATLLSSFGWRATVFAVTSYVGRTNQWPGQASFVPEARLLSWGELGELNRAGWEIGAHSRTHPDLTRLDDHRLADEILNSKAILEDRLGQEVTSFAYPMGRFDTRALALVMQHFHVGCTTGMGVSGPTSDPFQLERIETWYFSRYALQNVIGSPLALPYIRICRLIRESRARIGRRRSAGDLVVRSGNKHG